jgi:hypothetical protein
MEATWKSKQYEVMSSDLPQVLIIVLVLWRHLPKKIPKELNFDIARAINRRQRFTRLRQRRESSLQ